MSDLVSSTTPSVITGLSVSLAPSASVSQAALNLLPAAQNLPLPLSERERMKPGIIAALLIDIALTDRSKSTVAGLTLPNAFERFKAITVAKDRYTNMVDDKSWAATGIRTLRDFDIIEVFIGKSLYYQQWEKIFNPVIAHYPIMSDWLEGSTNKTSLQVWREAKTTPYDRDDLRAWLKNGGTLKKKKEKKEKEQAGKDSKKERDKDKESGSKKKDKHRISKGSKR